MILNLKGVAMTEFLQLLETLGSVLNENNIDSAVTLVQNLITLAEKVKSEVDPVAAPKPSVPASTK